MSPYRQRELDAPPFRSGRFHLVGAHWYAATREQPELGPFGSREQAKMAVATHVAEIATADDRPTRSAVSADPDSITARVQELHPFIRIREEHGIAVARVWAEGRLNRLEAEPLALPDLEERMTTLKYLLESY